MNSADYAGPVSEAEWDRSRCSVAGTLAVVGEKWSLLVLREAFFGVRRFADFQRILGAPVLLVGFGLPGENAHAPNEWMSDENFVKGMRAAAVLYEELGRTAR